MTPLRYLGGIAGFGKENGQRLPGERETGDEFVPGTDGVEAVPSGGKVRRTHAKAAKECKDMAETGFGGGFAPGRLHGRQRALTGGGVPLLAERPLTSASVMPLSEAATLKRLDPRPVSDAGKTRFPAPPWSQLQGHR